MSETVTPQKFRVEGEAGSESDDRMEQALGGPAIEVVAKATRQRFTVELQADGRLQGSRHAI